MIASINLNGVTQFDGIARYGKEQTMIYRLDYFMNGKWTTWGFYEDADEAQDVAFEHQRVYGSEDVRVVPIPKYLC